MLQPLLGCDVRCSQVISWPSKRNNLRPCSSKSEYFEMCTHVQVDWPLTCFALYRANETSDELCPIYCFVPYDLRNNLICRLTRHHSRIVSFWRPGGSYFVKRPLADTRPKDYPDFLIGLMILMMRWNILGVYHTETPSENVFINH